MIGCFNFENSFVKSLDGSVITDTKSLNYDGIVINWIPTFLKEPPLSVANLLIQQTFIVEECVKKHIPLVIFDGDFSLTKDEVNWLKNSNVKLFEPCLVNRPGFSYLPFYIETKSLNNIPISDERNINLGYIGDISSKIDGFNNYIVENKKCFSMKVEYNSFDIPSDLEILCEKLYILNNPLLSFSDIEYTIVIGNEFEYNRGVLNKSFFDALKNNCIPLIPEENRYYRGFSTIIDKKTKFNFFVNTYKYVNVGMIYEIYNNINEFYPEMKINHTVDVIKNCFK